MNRAAQILLVDDDADDRELFLESVLEIDSDIRCHTAHNADEAMRFLNDSSHQLPDYIFLDLNMPKVNGKQCLQQIKKNNYLKNIPVIIYTASNDVNSATELRDMGASLFVTKPMNRSEVYYLVSLALNEIRPNF